MIVQKIEFRDVFAANCYFYIDEKTNDGFIIDPSAHADQLLDTVHQNNWRIKKILVTHSHLDHIGAVLEISQKLNVPFYGLNTAKQYLSDPALFAHFTDQNVLKSMSYLNDGDELILNENAKLKVMATPGHTIDSVIYYDEKNSLAFTGDTIFKNGVGRTDIEGSGGDEKLLLNSIKTKIFTLPPHTVLYPGHGPKTTVQEESF